MNDSKKKMVPGDPMPMKEIAELLYHGMQKQNLELVGLDIRGAFRVGSDQIEGSVVGGGESDWKLYESDSWEYRYLIDKELRQLKIRKVDRIITMFRNKDTGDMVQGRLLQEGEEVTWRMVGMKPQED